MHSTAILVRYWMKKGETKTTRHKPLVVIVVTPRQAVFTWVTVSFAVLDGNRGVPAALRWVCAAEVVGHPVRGL
jgi:hypothetical protein